MYILSTMAYTHRVPSARVAAAWLASQCVHLNTPMRLVQLWSSLVAPPWFNFCRLCKSNPSGQHLQLRPEKRMQSIPNWTNGNRFTMQYRGLCMHRVGGAAERILKSSHSSQHQKPWTCISLIAWCTRSRAAANGSKKLETSNNKFRLAEHERFLIRSW